MGERVPGPGRYCVDEKRPIMQRIYIYITDGWNSLVHAASTAALLGSSAHAVTGDRISCTYAAHSKDQT